jgi:hypothetical protein
VARVSARFSKSFTSRRLRPNHEKVRSTTQRRGRTTKPFMLLLRLTISRRSHHIPPGKYGDSLWRPDSPEQWRGLLPSYAGLFDLDMIDHSAFPA